MKRTIVAAAALLLIQVALAVALNMTDTTGREVSPAAPLLSFSADAATALEITGPAGERLTIRRLDGGWVLPEAYNAPASGDQVTGLLAKLAELKQGLAVATTEEAARRFKVADNAFERHVVVKKDEETIADLYVGTSPGFRQVHARRAGATDIVTVALNTFELETGPDKWLDKNLFGVRQEEMETVSFKDFTLQKKDGTWQLAGLEEGRTTAKEAADDLVNGVSGLTIQDVVKPEEAANLFSGEPVLVFTVGQKDGTSLEYRFAKPAEDYFVVKRSDRELYGKVHTIQVENLRKYTREQLILQDQAPASPPSAGAEAMQPEEAKEPEAASAPEGHELPEGAKEPEKPEGNQGTVQ